MKPLPKGLIQYVTGTVEERPWWRLTGGMDGPSSFVWVRRDQRMAAFTAGAPGWVRDPRVRMTWLHGAPPRDEWRQFAYVTGPVVLAEIDAEHPLPRPPWRTGQVWASEDGTESACVVGVDGCLPVFGLETKALRERHLGTFEDWLTILLHDPLFPGEAPWSPP